MKHKINKIIKELLILIVFVFIFAYLSNFKEINMKKYLFSKKSSKSNNAYRQYNLSLGMPPFIDSNYISKKGLVNTFMH